MTVYIFSGLVLVVLILLYIIFNLYRKVSLYEEWTIETLNELNSTVETWKELDSKQLFEKDDEVGVIFDELNITIKNLEKRLDN
jgi:hypothetical protein